MTKDIKEAVEKCEICAAFQAKNVKQPMQTHEIPDRPWSRVSSDLFTLNGKEYIVLADSYSDFIEVGELKGTTASYIIEFLKGQFSRHGIPDVFVTDNGPQYCCREFTEFSREWEFKHVTSTRTLLPVSANLLYPRVEEGVKEKLKAKRQTAKGYYDRSAKVLPELEIGQEVRVAGQRNKVWEAGTCVQKLSDRSYLVEVNGNTLRRNRQALRPKKDTQMTGETTIAETKSLSSVPAETEGQTALRSTNHSEVTTPVKVSPYQNCAGTCEIQGLCLSV